MSNKVLSLILLASLTLCACTQREELDRDWLSLTVSNSLSGEKTSLKGNSVVWNLGDELSVFDGVANRCFKTVGRTKGANATFEGVVTKKEGSYIAVYPYNEDFSCAGTKVSAFVPSIQKAVYDSFDPAANLSAGMTYEDDGKTAVTLHNAGSYLKFFVGGEAANVSKVTLISEGGEQLSGAVDISVLDKDRISVSSAGSLGENRVTMVSDSAFFSPGTYYLVFSPGEFSQGLRIEVAHGDYTKSYSLPTLKSTGNNSVYSISTPIEDDVLEVTHEGILDEVHIVGATSESLGLEVTPWNSWKTAEDVKKALRNAVEAKKSYFSMFKFYNYETTGSLDDVTSRRYGHPFMYALDFYKGSGVYFSAASIEKIRGNTINIVKRAWANNRSIANMSWHLENPFAERSTYGASMGCRYCYYSSGYPEKYRYVARDILENRQVDTLGIHCLGDWFDERVRDVADMINQFVDEEGNPIPFIFRLWHELEDGWAWWQLDNYSYTFTSLEDYKALFRLTVEKFRKYCPNAQILWAYCHDRNFYSEERFLMAYPGDDVVDIVGYDDYHLGRPESYGSKEATLDMSLSHLRWVSSVARKHGKLAAIFETGNNSETGDTAVDNQNNREFYNEYVIPLIKDPESDLAIFQLWSGYDNTDSRVDALKEFLKNDEAVIFNH